MMALVPSWSAQIAGRLIAGLGGVLLNVIMSKMVTDWFAGREIASAMAIFVNSWPVGIALALVGLPPVGSAFGVAGGASARFGCGRRRLRQRSPCSTAPPPSASSRVRGGRFSEGQSAGGDRCWQA